MFCDRGHTGGPDISGIAVLFRAESVTPHTGDARVHPALDHRGEPVVADREELRSVIEDAVTDSSGCETSADAATFVDDGHGMALRDKLACGDEAGKPGSNDDDFHQAARDRRWARSARRRKLISSLLKVDACSTMKPCAAPEMTTSSAVGIFSANISLSPRGVRMS